MDNRIPHKKSQMPDLDLSKPLNIHIIGTEDDPCFGKLHSLTSSDCRMCGDNEACSIVTAQIVNTKRRSKEHREHKFKDLEEAELMLKQEKTIRIIIKRLHEKTQEDVLVVMVAKRFMKKITTFDLLSAKLIVKSYVARNPEKYRYIKSTKSIKVL